MLSLASTISYHKHLFGSVSTTNALPEQRDKGRLLSLVLWEEKSLSQNADKIHYLVSGPGERKANGAPIFHSPSSGTGRRGQKPQPRAQTSKAAVVTNTEVDSESSFTSLKTDKSFGAKRYDNKSPNKKSDMHVLYMKNLIQPSLLFPFRPMDFINNTNVQKPDIILVDYSLHSLPLRWCNIITHFKLTDSILTSTSNLYWGSATKGYLMMREQP
ncbi:hypothetical protein P692DRAFT_20843922 [Suillus brevipes Sb2]|nr:hypothetical protein P692DRAFT_20843922 [Suillus brevipes Sb2]